MYYKSVSKGKVFGHFWILNKKEEGAINMKLRGKIMMLGVIPIVGIALIVSFVANIQLRNVMKDVVKEDLRAITQLEYSNISNWEGNSFSVDSEGNMLNDTINLSENVQDIDEIKEETGIDVTVFYKTC